MKKKTQGRADDVSPKVAELRAALVSDDFPLAQFRELMPEGSPEQDVVVFVFAAILDTNSAGLYILLDRYDSDELNIICKGLQTVGATETLTDLQALRRAFGNAVASGLDQFQASDQVAESEMGRALSNKTELHVGEMESKLLKYCRDNVEILARE